MKYLILGKKGQLGKAFVKENKGLVFHHQKARIIHEQRND